MEQTTSCAGTKTKTGHQDLWLSVTAFAPIHPRYKKTSCYHQHSKEWAWENHLVKDFGIRPCIAVFQDIGRANLESYPEPPGGKNDN